MLLLTPPVQVAEYRVGHTVTALRFGRYVGSMVAKDFKYLAQVCYFLYPWFDSSSKTPLWLSISALTKMAFDMSYVNFAHQKGVCVNECVILVI